MKKRMNKSKFIKNLPAIFGVILLVSAVLAFSVSVRSNMTGNAVCTRGVTKEGVGCTTNDCYWGLTELKCTQFVGTSNYWKNNGCKKVSYSFNRCLVGQTCSAGKCIGTGCVASGRSFYGGQTCCSGLSTGGFCCNSGGVTSSNSGNALDCCSRNAAAGKCCGTGQIASGGKCCTPYGNTGCSATSPCCGGTCTSGKCCTINGEYTSSASNCCSGKRDYQGKCTSCTPSCLPHASVACGTNPSDGCGGSCGYGTYCSSGQSCSNRVCITATPTYSYGQCKGWSYCYTSPGCNCGTGDERYTCEADYGQQYCASGYCTNPSGCNS